MVEVVVTVVEMVVEVRVAATAVVGMVVAKVVATEEVLRVAAVMAAAVMAAATCSLHKQREHTAVSCCVRAVPAVAEPLGRASPVWRGLTDLDRTSVPCTSMPAASILDLAVLRMSVCPAQAPLQSLVETLHRKKTRGKQRPQMRQKHTWVVQRK